MTDKTPEPLPRHVLPMSVWVIYVKQRSEVPFLFQWNFQNEPPRWLDLPQENHQNSTISLGKLASRETMFHITPGMEMSLDTILLQYFIL